MPTLKEYNVTLSRLRNTRKITGTMKMVAANKLRKAEQAGRRLSDFEGRLRNIVSDLRVRLAADSHPLLSTRSRVSRVLVLVVTSDRGLCGGFNHNVNKAVLNWAAEQARRREVLMSFCGNRGFLFFRDRARVLMHYEGAAARPSFSWAQRLSDDLQKTFLSGRVDEVYLAYNRSRGALSQEPVIERLLPVNPDPPEEEPARDAVPEFLVDPAPLELARCLVPFRVSLKIYEALVASAVGEQVARMTAMDSATRNADNLIETVRLLRNRMRQAQITTELTEIIAGAEALK